jgi:hypothetical protein
VKLRLSLKLYAALCFVTAALSVWRAIHLATAYHILDTLEEVTYSFGYAAATLWLGIGILRRWPGARHFAMVICWLSFALFTFFLVSWCIWPHSIIWSGVVVISAIAFVNLWVYIVLRKRDVHALFDPIAASRRV